MTFRTRIRFICIFALTACALLCVALFSACVIKNPEPDDADGEHEHSYSTEWTYDYRGHWHLYDCGHILEGEPEIFPHNFVDFVCTDCGYEYVTQGLEYKLSDDGKTCAVSGIGSATDEFIVIPRIYSRNSIVTSVNFGAFKDCTRITGVKLTDSVTTVSGSAFENCTSLTRFEGGEKLEVISNEAFKGCTSLTEVILPESLNRIIYSAFAGCTALESVNLPASVTSIGYGAFDGCSSLKEINLPEGLTGIDRYTFRGCASLQSITLPAALQAIRISAFEGCTALEELNFGANFGAMEASAFKNCAALKEIILPEKVTLIPEEAFSGCSSLTAVTINGNITEYGKNVFNGCASLESLTLPLAVKTVADETTLFGYLFGKDGYEGGTAVSQQFGTAQSVTYYLPDTLKTVNITGGNILYGTFYNCACIENITLPYGVTSIANYAFFGCASLTGFGLPQTLTSLGEYSFTGCSSLAQVTIPQAIKTVGTRTFYNCTSLESVTIPKTTTAFRAGAFGNCTVESVIYGGNIADWCGISFQSEANPLNNKLIIGGEQITELIIPDSVTVIAMNAFTNFSSLTGVTLHGNVSEIGLNAFGGSGITEITIPNGVSTIAQGAFMNCAALERVELSSNLTELAQNVFYGCSNLTAIVLPEGLEAIGMNAFAYSGLAEITLPESISEIHPTAFDQSAITFNRYDSGLYLGSSGNDYFALIGIEDKAITALTVHADTKLICSAVLSGCGMLESLTIPFIGKTANADSASAGTLFGYIFGSAEYEGGKATTQYYAKQTASVKSYIPATLKSVTVTGGKVFYGAFYNCDTLENIVLPDGITAIEESTFYTCESLEELVIPEGVTSLGASALYLCSSLKKLTLPDSLTEYGGNSSFNSLEELTAPAAALGFIYTGTNLKQANLTSGDAVPENAFKDNAKLESVILSDSITSVRAGAFSGCSALTQLTMPAKLTGIGNGAFENCTNLAVIDFPEQHVSTIGNRAFYNCSALTEFVIHTTTNSIGSYAFYGCDSLNYNEYDNALYIPKSGSDYYYGYYYLAKAKNNFITSCTIQTNTVFIQDEAFKGCNYLAEVYLPDAIKTIGTDVFSGCRISKASIPSQAISYLPKTYLEDLTISSGAIPSLAYSGCAALKKLTIGAGVTEIGKRAFYPCINLETANFEVNTGWRRYSSETDANGVALSLNSGDSEENARYLKTINLYTDYIWKRG